MGGSLDVELAYDGCSQIVLPWSNPAEDWVRDAQALPSILNGAKRVQEAALALPEEIDEQPLQELRELAALKAMAENELLRNAANDVFGKIDAAMKAVQERKKNTAEWEEKKRT